ncbi:hypothetical protein Tco_1381349 [Tanacetum coccineum]
MLPQCLSLNCCKPSKQSSLAHPLHDQSNQLLPIKSYQSFRFLLFSKSPPIVFCSISSVPCKSGSSFMNIDNDWECASNTPIGAKIDKIEQQIGEGKLRLLYNDGNPLVPMGNVESDSEVELVFNETANLRILMSGKDGSDKGYGNNSLLEQWRDSYPDNDDYDTYDDDMYENHDMSEHL